MKRILLIFSCLIAGCASEVSSNDTDWYFQIAAPKHYEIWVEHLEFERGGYGHWSHPAGTLSCCWRGRHGPTGITGRLTPFPDFIGIQWFSLAERKRYQRLILVKPEWRNRMLELAPVETPSGTRYEPRSFLVLGLAPGGQIVIWMKGQIGNEAELARLQANEIEVASEEYRLLINSYIEENGEYIEKHGIPLEGW